MNDEIKSEDIVTHPKTGGILLRVISPPNHNNYEIMIAEYQNGLECVTIQDKPSKFTFKISAKDNRIS